MRLILDLRYAPGDGGAEPEGRVVTLPELAAAVRRPRDLAALLWGQRWREVRLVRDAAARSGVQAGAVLLACLARTEGFELRDGDGRPRSVRRAALLGRAIPEMAIAGPRELWHTLRLLRAIDRKAARPPRLIPRPAAPRSVAYLRTEPNIAFVGRYVGGAAAHTTGVINGLADCGLNVKVFAPQRPNGVEAPCTTVLPRRVHHLVSWLTVTAYGEEVVRAAAGERTDFVYQRYALGSFAGVELADRLGVPLLALEQANLRAASLVVVVSEVLNDQVQEIGIPVERILVNPNGVDPERLAPYRDHGAPAWRGRLGLEQAPTVGFVGTFGYWHGVTVLPMMVEELARTHPDVRWLLIGGGQLYDDVRGQIEERGLTDRVTVTGIVQRERALELLAASDVCVSPHVPNPDGTRFFGSPTKLFEYMGLAKPIVASDLEQIGEVIDHERTGLLCPPGDAGAAAAAVARLLDDELLRRRLGEAALEEAETTYSWTAHARRILEALER